MNGIEVPHVQVSVACKTCGSQFSSDVGGGSVQATLGGVVAEYRKHYLERHADSWEKLAKDAIGHVTRLSGKPCGPNCGTCNSVKKLSERAKLLEGAR